VANIKSQIKRVKTNEKRRQRNKSVRSAVRTAVRRFREAVEAGDTDKATELQRAAARALDKAASKGVIHRNQAANRKSAMACSALGASQARSSRAAHIRRTARSSA
jgi:small subunit ribosomal protein S20